MSSLLPHSFSLKRMEGKREREREREVIIIKYILWPEAEATGRKMMVGMA